MCALFNLNCGSQSVKSFYLTIFVFLFLYTQGLPGPSGPAGEAGKPGERVSDRHSIPWMGQALHEGWVCNGTRAEARAS